jgi:hypothetical protein
MDSQVMIKDEVVILNGKDSGEGKWSHYPELLRKVVFRKTNNHPILYITNVDGLDWKVTMNDFPDEPLYTIYIDDNPVMSFNDWPNEIWKIK